MSADTWAARDAVVRLSIRAPHAEPHARKRRQSNYLRGVACIALSGDFGEVLDQVGDTIQDDDGFVEALGGYGSVHVLATVFELPTDLVAEDVLRCHRIMERNRQGAS